MRISLLLVVGMMLLAPFHTAWTQKTISDVLSDPALNSDRPADRARAVERIRAIENAGKQRARAKTDAMGIPMRRQLPNGVVAEIMGLDENGEFLIYTTHNANAAISTAADRVHDSPYNLDGNGLTVGVWDGGGVRNTHQEFATGSRVTIMDGAAFINHATHVAGTIAAAGVVTNARGMANQALIHSYDWNSDTSEMLNRGATAPGQADKIYVSNHSYGYVEGWYGNEWRGTGTDQNAYDPQFGQYSSAARAWDDVAFNTPYYLIFKSAGNDNSNNPSPGSSVVIGGNTVSYDPAIHPPGDGLYRNTSTNAASGYENISTNGTAKNIMSVGAANDAVTNGLRDPAKSTLTIFSSRGPTDDGRIKPDIVANGAGLYSPVSGSDTQYGNYSGTSMSSPNATGSAALLVQLYGNLFPNGALRASTLKALIIHTATDIGNPGPDYHYGWGLMNTKEAADLMIAHHANPPLHQITEAQLTTNTSTQSYDFGWDGASPIRATIAWADPIGTSTTAHDSRTSVLVNNLDLKLIAPDGTEYFPFVMPFVGTWTVESMSAHATTGINNTDNVEQVLVANPGQPGVWRAEVTCSGSLTNSAQDYGLILSGVDQQVDEQAPTPDPMTWAVAPAPITGSDTEITMTATTASDPAGVEYYFTETSGKPGGADSGWQDGPSYTNTGLFPGTRYTYTVTARDNSSQLNATAPSAPASATTTGEPDTTAPTPNPMTFASFPAAGGSSSMIMTAATADDRSGVEYYFTETSGNPGGTDSGWQDGPTYEDTGLNSATAYTYTVTARDKSPNSNATTPSTPATGYSESVADTFEFANADITVSGNVTGTFADTQASDGMYQQLTETESGGKPDSRHSYLEHKWSFNITGGSSVTFHVEAHHTANTEGDNFVFAYSTTGVDGTYTDMLTVTKTADDDITQTFSLPATTRGMVHIRVRDLDQTAGNSSLDSLFIDSMYFVSAAEEADANPPTLVSITDNQTGGPVEFNSVVAYAVSFSKDMDSATVTDADFGNAGTSSITIGTISQVSPDVFSVPVTPTGTGTLRLRINAGADLRDVAGNPMDTTSALTDDIAIEVTGIAATATFGNLNQTYDGGPKPVAVTTDPSGLAHTVTYDGISTVPVNAGSYETVATITDPNYSGSTSGILVIAKASQTINFAALNPVADNQPPFDLSATASSGLTVSYTSSAPTVAGVSGSTVTVNSLGTTTLTASQAGNENHLAAANVQQDLTVVRSNPLAIAGGPYKVLFGQTLSLNGSASEPSYGESIYEYAWDLNNDNTFNDVFGTTPTAIPFDDLVNIWGMSQGLNTIQLRVTDSAAKTSIVSATVELVLSLQWDANGTSGGQTNGGGPWLGNDFWWDGATNVNWVPGSNAVFGGPSTAGGSVTLASPTSVNVIILNTFTGTYALGSSAQALTLNGGMTHGSAAGAASIISPVVLGGAQSWVNHSTAFLTIGNASTSDNIDNGGFTITADGTGRTRVWGSLSGSGGIIKNGPGVLDIGGQYQPFELAHSYTGTTTINAGALQVQGAANIGAGNLIIQGGTLQHYYQGTFTRSLGAGNNQVHIPGGTSGFGIAGSSGTIRINNDANFELVWGGVHFNPDAFLLQGAKTNTNAKLTLSNKIDLNGATRTIRVDQPGGDLANGYARISGIIRNSSGTAGITKTGIGQLILDANNTYNGDTTVVAGNLRLNHGNSSNEASTVQIATDATLQLNFSGTDTVDQLFIGETQMAAGVYKAIGSAASGNGLAQITGTGTLTVTSDPTSGTVDSFVITGVPAQPVVGMAITGVTLTAMNANGDTATSFTGTVTFGGTAGITGTSESFVDGVLQNMSLTPTIVGNDLTFTVDDGSGHIGSSTFNVVSALYNDWSTANGLTGAAADPDTILQPDGLTNLTKFAYGMDPNIANFSPLEYVAQGELTTPGAPTLDNFAPPGTPDDEHAVFARRKDHASAGLVYTVHFSADLKQWTASGVVPTVLTDPNTTSDHEVVSVPFSDAVPVEDSGDPKSPKFMRVTISME